MLHLHLNITISYSKYYNNRDISNITNDVDTVDPLN